MSYKKEQEAKKFWDAMFWFWFGAIVVLALSKFLIFDFTL